LITISEPALRKHCTYHNRRDIYIYGPANSGCAGIPEAASDSDHHLTDKAFKLLTLKETGIKELALSDLQTTMQKRLGRQTDHQDVDVFCLEVTRESSGGTPMPSLPPGQTQERPPQEGKLSERFRIPGRQFHLTGRHCTVNSGGECSAHLDKAKERSRCQDAVNYQDRER
jgi:hypothetical protein